MAADEQASGTGLTVFGGIIYGFIKSGHDLHIIASASADALIKDINPSGWYPLQILFGLQEFVINHFSDSAPVLQRIGAAMMDSWYHNGPGKKIIRSGTDFLLYQSSSEGYRSVVRGPERLLGNFSLVEIDDREGTAFIHSTTPFNRDLEKGIILGGMSAAGDLDQISIDNSADKDYFRIRFHRDVNARINDLVASEHCPEGVSLVSNDIADLFYKFKGLQAELEREKAYGRSSRQHMEAVISAIGERDFWIRESQRVARLGSYVLDIRAGTITTSEILDDIFGIGPDYDKSVSGWRVLIHPDDRERVMKYFADVINSKKHFEAEYRILRPVDGQERWVFGLGEVVPDSNGMPVKMLGTVQDITERRLGEEELRKYHDHLEEMVGQRTRELAALNDQLRQSQKLEAVGLLAGGIAHDFSNILTTIKGALYLIRKKLETESPLIKYAEQALSSISKANSLTQSLLAFSRKQAIILQPVDLNEIVEKTANLLAQIIGEHIELDIKLTVDKTVVMADINQVEQVLLNLSTNARDAMPDGGKLQIKTGIAGMDEAFIKEHGFGAAGSYVLMTVADTGMGIEDTIKEKIFEPFFTTKVLGKGSGLGLAVIYGIVKQHNGYIDVESEYLNGTTFRIYLPLVEATAAHSHIGAVEPAEGGCGTILFAEDDEDARRILSEVLRLSGYRVIEAKDGEDAVKAFMGHKERIDLIMLDVRMPRKNGREAYEAIRRVSPGSKFLFVSGYTDDIIDSHGIREEGFNFISKASSPDEILEKIRLVIE
ncbi:MAG: response regulator [Nitrospirae bacterium]|nr:response regulator [Nitrospirota bacterium]